MSGLASLANIPASPETWAQFNFAHAAHHRDINRLIFIATNIALPEFILDPVDIENPGVFSFQHQTMHNNQNSILGITGLDLTDVNWQDDAQKAIWFWLNFQEHYQASGKLPGLG